MSEKYFIHIFSFINVASHFVIRSHKYINPASGHTTRSSCVIFRFHRDKSIIVNVQFPIGKSEPTVTHGKSTFIEALSLCDYPIFDKLLNVFSYF